MTLGKPELYNMMRNLGELYNVIDFYPDKVEEIMVEMEKSRKEMRDWNAGIAKGTETREMGRLDIR